MTLEFCYPDLNVQQPNILADITYLIKRTLKYEVPLTMIYEDGRVLSGENKILLVKCQEVLSFQFVANLI